jgi:hypothetical protein
VLTDVPMTLVVMASLLLSLRAHERATVGAFALAGAAAGLAGALKYNGVLAAVMPLIACVMTPGLRTSRVTAALAVIAATMAAFLAAAPYTLLDLSAFLNQFARLSSEYHKPPSILEPIWQVYLKHLRNALDWPGSLMVIGGFAVALWNVFRDRDRLKWVLALTFPLLYFRFISQQTIVFGRYLLPLVPFLSILAAAFVVAVVAWMRRANVQRNVRNVATLALTMIAIMPPAYTSVNYDAGAAKTWTQRLAYDWIRLHLPAGAAIRLEGSLAIRLPPPYNVTYAKELRLDHSGYYLSHNIDYLVASSQCYGQYLSDPATYPLEHNDYLRLFDRYEEVARFAPSPDHPGPELRVLKVKRP